MEYLEKIYFTFIRPILEYASEVWDNCGELNSNRLEKIHIEAARLPCYASLISIYNETGWEKLRVRREVKKLTLFYKIVNNEAPDYLHDLIPPTLSETNNYNLRNSQNINLPLSRLSVYQRSYISATIQLWNSLDLNTRQIPTFSTFKLKLQRLHFKNKKPPCYFAYGDRLLSVLHARLRNKCSILNADLFKANLVENAKCMYLRLFQ